MKLCYSVTINVSPYKKYKTGSELWNYHGLDLLSQQGFILEIQFELQNIVGGDWGAYVWELTQKGDQHFHGTVVLDAPITENQFKQINIVSAKYGSNQYNRCIDLQYCVDGGKHWREKYMQKQQCNSPKSPEIRDDRTVPFSVFGVKEMKPSKVKRNVFGHKINEE